MDSRFIPVNSVLVKNPEFGGERKTLIPKRSEVDTIFHANLKSQYYSHGIEACRRKAAFEAGRDVNRENYSNGFLQCRRFVNKEIEIYTQNKFTADNLPTQAKPYLNEYYKCLFKDLDKVQVCNRQLHLIAQVALKSDE